MDLTDTSQCSSYHQNEKDSHAPLYPSHRAVSWSSDTLTAGLSVLRLFWDTILTGQSFHLGPEIGQTGGLVPPPLRLENTSPECRIGFEGQRKSGRFPWCRRL